MRGRISDLEAERVLTGQHADGSRADLEEITSFVGMVRATVPARLDPAAEADLIGQLAATARVAGDGAPARTAAMRPVRIGGWRPRLALAAKAAFAVALLPAAIAAAAIAGVTLPEPAREAMERLGLDLPNQSAVDEPATTDSDEPADERAKGNGKASRDKGAADAKRANRGGKAAASDKPGRRGGPAGAGNGRGRPDEGESRGAGEPQLGEPAPIVPPGQGGVPPGLGGPSPSEGRGQSSEPHGSGASGSGRSGNGAPGGTLPDQAKR